VQDAEAQRHFLHHGSQLTRPKHCAGGRPLHEPPIFVLQTSRQDFPVKDE
jgi:hypothetical protein